MGTQHLAAPSKAAQPFAAIVQHLHLPDVRDLRHFGSCPQHLSQLYLISVNQCNLPLAEQPRLHMVGCLQQ